MMVIRRILKALDDYFSKDERAKIRQLEGEKKQLQVQIKKLQEEIKTLNARISSLSMEASEKAETIKFYEQLIYGTKVRPPEWLDTTKKSYWPKREIDTKSGSTELVEFSPRDLYVPCPTLVEFVQKKKWHKLEHDEKLLKIWEFVVRSVVYQYDKLEDWRHPIITYNYRKGDCEDGTILFVTLCRIAGVPANKVFNACGYFYSSRGKFGHSFPIAQMSDGKWYVFETTLDVVTSWPVLFKGSSYDASWGVHNWMFDGMLKKECKQKDGKYQV